MKSTIALAAALAVLAGTSASAAELARPRLITDAEIAKAGDGPHEGKGPTIGHPFSVAANAKGFYFSKRILKPGSTVGRHVMDSEEVYYLQSGEAEFIDEVGSRIVKAGTAIFMQTGNTAELRQRGKEDAILIVISPPQ